jgi:hypothetical protein
MGGATFSFECWSALHFFPNFMLKMTCSALSEAHGSSWGHNIVAVSTGIRLSAAARPDDWRQLISRMSRREDLRLPQGIARRSLRSNHADHQ